MIQNKNRSETLIEPTKCCMDVKSDLTVNADELKHDSSIQLSFSDKCVQDDDFNEIVPVSHCETILSEYIGDNDRTVKTFSDKCVQDDDFELAQKNVEFISICRVLLPDCKNEVFDCVNETRMCECDRAVTQNNGENECVDDVFTVNQKGSSAVKLNKLFHEALKEQTLLHESVVELDDLQVQHLFISQEVEPFNDQSRSLFILGLPILHQIYSTEVVEDSIALGVSNIDFQPLSLPRDLEAFTSESSAVERQQINLVQGVEAKEAHIDEDEADNKFFDKNSFKISESKNLEDQKILSEAKLRKQLILDKNPKDRTFADLDIEINNDAISESD